MVMFFVVMLIMIVVIMVFLVVVVVSPGGHSPFIEHPRRYVATVESFFADISR